MDPQALLDRLKQRYPDQLANTSILSTEGRAGLLLDHGDGTLSKVLYKPKDHTLQDSVYEDFQTELNGLRYFRENPPEDMALPSLIGDAVIIDKDPDVFAMYRMTKLEGQPAEWKYSKPPVFETESAFEDYFARTGAMLAQFHQAAAGITDVKSSENQPGSAIPQITGADADLNAQLQQADRYLQQHKRPVIGHGDFHGGNLMQDEKGNITGVIDFGLMHKWDNKMMEFLNIPEAGLKSFIKAYEQQSGEKIDPAMILLTEVSLKADQANRQPQNSPEQAKAIQSVQHYLSKALPYLEQKPDMAPKASRSDQRMRAAASGSKFTQ